MEISACQDKENECPEPEELSPVGPPLLEARINGIRMLLAADTAAGRSVMALIVFKTMYPDAAERDSLLKSTTVRLTSATGHELQVVGYFEANIEIGNLKPFKHPIIVFKSNTPEFLLGNDIIRDKITIDKSRFAVIDTAYGEENIPLTYNVPTQPIVCVTRTEVLPEHRCRMQARVTLQKDDQGCVTFVPADSLENRIAHVFGRDDFDHQVKESVSLINPGLDVEIVLENPTPEKLVILPGQVVAFLDCFDSNEIYEVVKREVQVKTKTEFVQNVDSMNVKDKNVDKNEIKNNKKPQKTQKQSKINQIDAEGLKDLVQGREDGLLPDPAGYDIELDNRSLPKDTKMKEVDFDEIKTNHLTPPQKRTLFAVLEKNRGVFARSQYDIGLTNLASYKINTGDSEPVVQPYRPIPFRWLPQVKEKLEALVDAGVIEESNSAWAANLVFVLRNDKLRICTDLTSVNALMIDVNQWPINHIADSFEKFVGSLFRSLLDCTAAYWAIPITDLECQKKTAFYGPGCLYHWKRAPFGLKDIPAIYNQIMFQIVKKFVDFCTFFFDDIAIFSNSFGEACEHLDIVLNAIKEAGFKLSLKKCRFIIPSTEPIDWLGFVIKDNLIHTDPKKVKAILSIPQPKTKKELQMFLGSLNYLARHIPNFAHYAAPLWDATSGVKKGAIEWGEAQIVAFHTVKRLLMEAPALRMIDHNRDFILTTDASEFARGWCLSQRFDEGELAVAYGSKKFSKEEQINLTMPEKELAAGIAAFAACYAYLVGKKFLWRVDAKALVFMKKFQKSHTRIAKFAHLMQGYSFDIEHQAAEDNTMMAFVDMLSRSHANDDKNKAIKTTYKELKYPIWNKITAPPSLPKRKLSLEEFDEYAEKYLMAFDKKYIQGYLPNPVSLDEIPMEPPKAPSIKVADVQHIHELPISSLDVAMAEIRRINEKQMPNLTLTESGMNRTDFVKVQRADSELDSLFELAESNRQKGEEYYFIKQGILMRNISIHPDYTIPTVVIPTVLREPIMSFYHGSLPGTHIGHKKAVRQIKRIYYWPSMIKDIKKFTQKCVLCLYHKPYTVAKPSAHRTNPPRVPNELVSIDLVVNLPRAYDGSRHILTMVDEFSKFAMAVPIPDKSGLTVAKAFIKNWFSIFGMPERWHSDQGTDTDAAVAQYLATILNCQKSRTPSYSPQANGACEAFNKLLGESIKMQLTHSDLKTWPIMIPFLVSAYNSTTHSKTESSPNEITFGRNPSNQLIPIVDFQHPIISKSDYLSTIRLAQEYFWEIASKNMEKHRKYRDPETFKLNPFEVGDFVMLKNTEKPKESKRKAHLKWLGPFRVLKKYPNCLLLMHWQQEPYISSSRMYHQGLQHLPYRVKLAHPNLCKPMKMPVERSPLYDPHLARHFLKELGYSNEYLDDVGKAKTNENNPEASSVHSSHSSDSSFPGDRPPVRIRIKRPNARTTSASSTGNEESIHPSDSSHASSKRKPPSPLVTEAGESPLASNNSTRSSSNQSMNIEEGDEQENPINYDVLEDNDSSNGSSEFFSVELDEAGENFVPENNENEAINFQTGEFYRGSPDLPLAEGEERQNHAPATNVSSQSNSSGMNQGENSEGRRDNRADANDDVNSSQSSRKEYIKYIDKRIQSTNKALRDIKSRNSLIKIDRRAVNDYFKEHYEKTPNLDGSYIQNEGIEGRWNQTGETSLNQSRTSSSASSRYTPKKLSSKMDESFRKLHAEASKVLSKEVNAAERKEHTDLEWDDQGMSGENSKSTDSEYFDSFQEHNEEFEKSMNLKEQQLRGIQETEVTMREVLEPKKRKEDLAYRDPKESLAPSYKQRVHEPIAGPSQGILDFQEESHSRLSKTVVSPREYIFDPGKRTENIQASAFMPEVILNEDDELEPLLPYGEWQRKRMQSRDSMGVGSPLIPILKSSIRNAESTQSSASNITKIPLGSKDGTQSANAKAKELLRRSAYGARVSQASELSSQSSKSTSTKASGRPIIAAKADEALYSDFDKETEKLPSSACTTRSGRVSSAPDRFSHSSYPDHNRRNRASEREAETSVNLSSIRGESSDSIRESHHAAPAATSKGRSTISSSSTIFPKETTTEYNTDTESQSDITSTIKETEISEEEAQINKINSLRRLLRALE